MISSIIQALFIKILPNMSEHKRSDKESMNCLTPKPNLKIFRNNCIFFLVSLKSRP